MCKPKFINVLLNSRIISKFQVWNERLNLKEVNRCFCKKWIYSDRIIAVHIHPLMPFHMLRKTGSSWGFNHGVPLHNTYFYMTELTDR